MAIFVTVTEALGSVTLPMLPEESVEILKERWGATREQDASLYLFRTSSGLVMRNEAFVRDCVPDPGSTAIEVIAERLSSLDFAVIGFPQASCRLQVDLSTTPADLQREICRALKIPPRRLRLLLSDRALKDSESFSRQAVPPLSLLSVDLLFSISVNTRWIPEEEEEEAQEIFGSEPARSLLDPYTPTSQQRLLLLSAVVPIEGSIAGALRAHGGLTEADWVLRLERQVAVKVRYPPPLARTEAVLVWPSDAVRLLLPNGAPDNQIRVISEGVELNPDSSFAELGIATGANLWIGAVISLRIEDSGGTQHVLRIADTATVAELRRCVAAWEASPRFHLSFDGAYLEPESRYLRRCGLAEGELVRLTPRKIPVLLLYKGARYVLGPINEEADFDELLVAASRAIGAGLDVDTVFECCHCRRAISLATREQRQMAAVCCRELPRLLRVHESSHVDLELQLTDANLTIRPPPVLAHGLVAFVEDQVSSGWRVRDVGAVRMTVQVSLERGESLRAPPHQPVLQENEREGCLRWWSPGAWLRRDTETAGVKRVTDTQVEMESRVGASLRPPPSLGSSESGDSRTAVTASVSFADQRPKRQSRLLSLPPFDESLEALDVANPTVLLANGATPLFESVRAGDAALVRSLLGRGADVNATCFSDATALHVAAMCGDTKVLQQLLEADANLNAPLLNGATPLLVAAEQSQEAAVRLLLGAGAYVDARLNTNVTALYLSAERGAPAIVALLLTHGAAVNLARNTGATPIFIAAQNGHFEVMKQLVEAGARLDASMAHGATPLYVAAQNGHLEIIQFLVNYRANVNAKMDAGATPLYVAAQNGHSEVTAFLLKHGADVNARSMDGTMALFIAAQNGHTRVVEQLLRAGAETNSPSDCPAGPLFIAAQNGHTGVVTALIKHGADVEAETLDGSTPLYVSAQNGHVAVVRILLNAGAKPNKSRHDGTTPLRIASQLRHRAVVALLEQHLSRIQSICAMQ